MRYITRFFEKHKVIYTLLILLLAVCCSFLGYLLDLGYQAKAAAVREEEKSATGACRMVMGESMSDQMFYSYMEDGTETFRQFQEFRNELETDSSYRYIGQFDQFIEVKSPQIPDIFLAGYEDGNADSAAKEVDGSILYTTKALQVSEGFLEKYELHAGEGRIFTKEDYSYQEDKPVPVVLGSAYKEWLELGDIIEAEYLFQPFQFQVIGFLEETAFYYNVYGNELIPCERYILMPAFSHLPENEFGKMALLQYFSAYIESEETYDQVLEKLEDKLQENGISEGIYFRNLEEEEQEINIFQMYTAMTDAVAKYFGIMIVIMIACIGFILTLMLTNMIQEENYNFGVYIMCGMKRGKLALLIFLLDGLIVGAGDVIALFFLIINHISWKHILLVQAVAGFILTASFVVCYFRVQKIDIAELIGGKE